MFDQGTLSDTLGALSIVTWLGAQSPQIYENYKNGSVEGLALPFLISWFWGDFTNFVGCVLTHQLPFQTYLATYFLIVDVALVSQYYYYSRRKPPQDLPPLSEAFPYAQGSGPHHPPYVHPRKASKSRQSRRPSRGGGGSRRSASYAHQSPSTYSSQDPLRQSFMSERVGTNSRNSRIRQPSDNSHSMSSSSLFTQGQASQIEPPSPTIPERGRTLTRNSTGSGGGSAALHTFDPTLSTIYGSPSVSGGGEYLMHTSQTILPHHHVSFNPASLTRTSNSTSSSSISHLQHGDDEEEEGHRHYQHHSQELSRASSSRSRPPPPSRRGTGIAFLSVGLLFTLGNQFGGGRQGGGGVSLVRREVGGAGIAWSTATTISESSTNWLDRIDLDFNQIRHPTFFSTSSPSQVSPSLDNSLLATTGSISKRSVYPLDVSFASPIATSTSVSLSAIQNSIDRDQDGEEGGERPTGPDWERIIGRMSAWLCTTLYLTSRLPQIWRNFRRRSVEGLAMTLFFFAFIGNSLYVASILTNPLAKTEPGYLIESTPYLLGSGGTLCFDLMIMFQSLIYSEKRRGGKRAVGKRVFDGDEEEGANLLGAEETEEDEGSERTTRGGGRRSRDSSLSLGYGRSISSSRSSRSRKNGGTNLSMTRSRSTDVLARGGRSASSSRGNLLEDRQFEWEGVTPTRVSSNSSSLISSGRGAEETILEAGESSVTVRS